MSNEKEKAVENEALRPTNDLLFKRIYGKEGSEQITEAFIKAFLGLEVKIEKLEDSEPLDISSVDTKAGVLDVLATEQNGTKIDIEIQVNNYTGVEERFAFYGLELFTEQFKKGGIYTQANKTIGILILKGDYSKYAKYKDYMLTWQLREKKYHDLILTDKIELCIISLEKIKKKIASGEISDKEKIAIWTKFLLTPQALKEEEMDANKEIKEANEKYQEMIADDETRRLAVKRHLALMEMAAAKNDGYQEGKDDRNKEIAKNMLNEKCDIELIIKVTGLTKEEIEKLK